MQIVAHVPAVWLLTVCLKATPYAVKYKRGAVQAVPAMSKSAKAG